MNRRLLSALTALMLAVSFSAAEAVDAGPFSVDATPELSIRYNGETLISGDRCVSFRGMKPGEPVLVDPGAGRVLRDGTIITTLATQGRNSLRREVMVTPEAVHITFEMQVFGATGGSHLQYDLLTPREYIDGADYKAWTGAPRGPVRHETGTISMADSKPLEYLIRSVRYITLNQSATLCSLDFNPGGPWVGETNYGHNKSTTPYHDGQQFHWLMLCTGGQNGGIFGGKVIIRAGAPDYETLHSTANVAYTSQFPVSLALNFTEGTTAVPYVSCSPQAPAGDGYRLSAPERTAIVRRPEGGMLYSDFLTAAATGGRGTLHLRQRSGQYLMTLNICDTKEDTGPFTISSGDSPLVEDVTIRRGDFWVKTVPLRFRNGRATLRFSGDWKIGALTLQPILYETEDFVLEGRWWNMEVNAAE